MTDRPDSSRRRALAQLSAGSLATLAPWALHAGAGAKASRSRSASSTSARATTSATTRRRPQAAAR